MNEDKLTMALSRSIVAIVGTASLVYLLQQLMPTQQAQAADMSNTYGLWYLGPAGHIMNVENNADEQPVYVGEAAPGMLNSDAGWRIYKYEYVINPATGDILSGTVRYANGTTSFDKIWDNRTEYEYR